MADDDYEPQSVVVDPIKECKQPVDVWVRRGGAEKGPRPQVSSV